MCEHKLKWWKTDHFTRCEQSHCVNRQWFCDWLSLLQHCSLWCATTYCAISTPHASSTVTALPGLSTGSTGKSPSCRRSSAAVQISSAYRSDTQANTFTRMTFIYFKCSLDCEGDGNCSLKKNVPILGILLWFLVLKKKICIEMLQKYDWKWRCLDYDFVAGSGDRAVLQLFPGGAQRAWIRGFLQPQVSCQDHVRVWPQTRRWLCHLL